MSENLQLPAPVTLKSWLANAMLQLESAGIASSRLDCLVLLSDIFNKDKSWILANLDNQALSLAQLQELNAHIHTRSAHTPLAYIRQKIEFYGREFIVNHDVLIPRPETEDMIDLVKNIDDYPNPSVHPLLIDVGTGSGCIGITLALERPAFRVLLTDVSQKALKVATLNADKHKAHVRYELQDLLDDIPPQSASIITANLPYVSESYEISVDAKAEPALALFSNDDGYELIEKMLPQAAKTLLPRGYLALESDPWQQERIIATATEHGFSLHEKRRFHILLRLMPPAESR